MKGVCECIYHNPLTPVPAVTGCVSIGLCSTSDVISFGQKIGSSLQVLLEEKIFPVIPRSE